MGFPAVPKHQARIRLFVTSEHTEEQMDRGAELLLDAARHFGFDLHERPIQSAIQEF